MDRFWPRIISFLLVLVVQAPLPCAWAKRSSEALYTEPFDLAAGGTALTRASQEGIIFANPALLPLGGAYVRWLGLQTGFILDRDLAVSGTGGIGAKAEGAPDTMVKELFEKSIHMGQSLTLSFLHKNFALGVFDRFEIDLEGSRYESAGLPAINLGLEAYGGAVVSAAAQPLPWLSLGVTGKYILLGEPNLTLPIADPVALQAMVSDTSSLRNQVNYGIGMGFDVGALILLQGRSLDYSMALKVDDLGDTSLSRDQQALPQSLHLGLGLAFHGSKEVLHLSLDYRDVLGAYSNEPQFKKIYIGSRLMLRKMLGFALGLYQGIPTFGLRADLYLLKLGITAYGRELGSYPGDRQRNMLLVYTSFGF